MQILSRFLKGHNRALFFGAAMALFAFHIHKFWTYFIDDVYIAYRYSRNLALGLGYVYNPKEYVEGCSSVIWTLWVALGIKLQIDPLLFSKVSGLVLGVALLIYFSVRVHAVVAFASACSAVVLYWLVTGMETPLFIFALAVAMGELYRRNLKVSALFFGLLPWVRPDGMYFTGLVLLPTLALHRREWALTRKQIGLIVLFVVLPFTALLAWRYFYFGDLQPNTYYAKFSMPWFEGFWPQLEHQGIPYVLGFWKTYPALFVLWLVSIFYAIIRREKFLLVLNAAFVFYQCYFAFIGGDWMPLHRWYAALIPAVFAMTLLLFKDSKLGASALIASACLSLLYQSYDGVLQSGFLRYSDKHDLFLRALGREMKLEKPYSESILMGDIGAVGYESDLRVIDGGALIDKHLARIPAIHFWKSDLPYLLAQKPDWVALRMHFYYHPAAPATLARFRQAIVAQPGKVDFPAELWKELARSGRWIFEQQLLGSDEFHARYSTVFVMPEFDQPQYFILFCEKSVCGSSRAKRLRDWVPNLGLLKSQLKAADAEAHLKKTFEAIPGEETSLLEYAKMKKDRRTMREVAERFGAMRANRIDAYTALGLEEYASEDFDAALGDFKSAISLGGNAKIYFSNVGWAYKALGKIDEANAWFEKAR